MSPRTSTKAPIFADISHPYGPSLAEGRNSFVRVPHASQSIPSICSNNMPCRAPTTYGQHNSTPIPSAPLTVELCSFMSCCVDWFRPASGSSGKRLQLPTSLCRVGQHPFLVPDYGQARLAPLSIFILSPKAVLPTYPCTHSEALKPLITHICQLPCPHRLSSRNPQSTHFLTTHTLNCPARSNRTKCVTNSPPLKILHALVQGLPQALPLKSSCLHLLSSTKVFTDL